MKTKNEPSQNTMNKLKWLIILVLIFTGGFLAGRFVDVPGLPGGSNVVITGDKSGDVESIDFDLFWRVWNTLSREYVDAGEVNAQEMFYGAIKGLVNSFNDPATLFLTPDETETFNEGNAGKYFEGIGAELGYENGQIVVIAPLSGSPAEEAGIRSGDVIYKVDGEEIKPSESIFDVVQKIRGEAGTEVVLTVLHKGDVAVEDIAITRGEITVPSIELKEIEGESNLILLDVARFTDASLFEWEENWDIAVDEILESGADGLILDLRGNPGGYFDAAIYAANEFLPKGKILAKQEDREGDQREYKGTREGRLLDIPVVILVDSGSASASEILAGALQQNDRAIVVGESTYGKGTAQSIVKLEGGASLHITTLKWLLPDGTWLSSENTIEPDVVVEFSEENYMEGVDDQLNEAVDRLKKQL